MSIPLEWRTDDARKLSPCLGARVACQMRGHGSAVVGESAFNSAPFVWTYWAQMVEEQGMALRTGPPPIDTKFV